MPGSALRRRLTDFLSPLIAGDGLDLEDVTVTTVGRRRLVRVVVDRDGGLDLDAAAELSRRLSAALDSPEGGELLAPGPYVLEVTSPGIDRPVRTARQWRRAEGRLVRVGTADGELSGRVVAADDESVTLRTADGDRRMRHSDLGPGRVQVEFARPAAEAAAEVAP
jgi:ribosome maturation factor RimP